MTIYENGLSANRANYAPLTPVDFLDRAATTWPQKVAIIHGDIRRTYLEFNRRSRQMASALDRRGIQKGDFIALLAANTPAMLEAHYGVVMAGAVLNALNYRLDPAAIAFILEHGGAKILFVDKEFSEVIEQAVAMMKAPPVLIGIDDALVPGLRLLGDKDYEEFLAEGDPNYELSLIHISEPTRPY